MTIPSAIIDTDTGYAGFTMGGTVCIFRRHGTPDQGYAHRWDFICEVYPSPELPAEIREIVQRFLEEAD